LSNGQHEKNLFENEAETDQIYVAATVLWQATAKNAVPFCGKPNSIILNPDTTGRPRSLLTRFAPWIAVKKKEP
jgi:hypothetical protein